MSHSSENSLPWTEILAEIKHHLSQIQYGSLEIQVHNGQVVQLERREKKRWDKVAQVKQIAS